MKRRIAGIVIMILLASICLAGCSEQQLEEKDFFLYDKNGNEMEFIESTEWKTVAADKYSYTSRGIKLGSTLEEVKKAYGDVWSNMEIDDTTPGKQFYHFKSDNKELVFNIPETSKKVESITILIYLKDDGKTE